MASKEKINRVKIVLAEKEVSQKDFAKKLSVTAHTVSRICNNETQPSLRLLRKMAQVLDVDIRELLLPTKGK